MTDATAPRPFKMQPYQRDILNAMLSGTEDVVIRPPSAVAYTRLPSEIFYLTAGVDVAQGKQGAPRPRTTPPELRKWGWGRHS
jgi:hypothetical protein